MNALSISYFYYISDLLIKCAICVTCPQVTDRISFVFIWVDPHAKMLPLLYVFTFACSKECLLASMQNVNILEYTGGNTGLESHLLWSWQEIVPPLMPLSLAHMLSVLRNFLPFDSQPAPLSLHIDPSLWLSQALALCPRVFRNVGWERSVLPGRESAQQTVIVSRAVCHKEFCGLQDIMC